MKLVNPANGIFAIQANPKATDWDDVLKVADMFYDEDFVNAEQCDHTHFVTICTHKGPVASDEVQMYKDMFKEFRAKL